MTNAEGIAVMANSGQLGSLELRPLRADGTRSARVVWTYNGEVRRRAFRTEWEAVKFRERLTRLAGNVPQDDDDDDAKDGGRTVADLVDEYSRSPHTRADDEAGRARIRQIFATMAGEHRIAKTRVSEVDAALAQATLDEIGADYTTGTLGTLRATLRASFRYAVAQGYVDAPAPFTGKMRVRGTGGRRARAKREPFAPVFLRDDEVTALLAAMPARWLLMVRVILASGIRIGEAYALRVMSVRVAQDGRVTLEIVNTASADGRALGRTKSRKVRQVPLPRALSAEVIALAGARHPAEWLFADVPSYSRFGADFAKAVEKAGLLASHPGGVRPHDLRHTHASQLMAAGVPIHTVSMWLGHSSIVVTVNLYGHIHVDDARLMSAIDSLE